MKFRKLVLLIPLLSSILFFSSTPFFAKAYNSDTYSDLDHDYEGDWGAYAPKRVDSSELNKSVPSSDGNDINNNAINTGNYYRFNHWAGVSTYGDCRGWDFDTREWATSSMYNLPKYWLPDYYFDGTGTADIPNNVFLYDGVLDAATYNEGTPWGYSNGNALNYMRWGIIWYKRLKPTPAMTDLGVNNFHTPYDTTDTTLWATPTDKGQIWCQAEDRYPESYGDITQKEGAVRRGVIWITGTNGLKYLGYTDMNDKDNPLTFWASGTSDTAWKKDMGKIVGMSNTELTTNTYYNSLKTSMTFKAEDGVDYDFKTRMDNKWIRSTSDYSNFYHNGVTKDVLKIDGEGPNWNKIEYPTTKIKNTASIVIDNINDMRGSSNNIEGCGVALNSQFLKVQPIDDIGSTLGLYKLASSPSVIETSGTGKTFDLKFDINFDKLGFGDHFGKFKIQFLSKDNLGNISNSEEFIIDRANPTPINAQIQLKNYKYAEPNTNNKWVNVTEAFQVYTSAEGDSIYNEAPDSTSLLIGGDGKHSTFYDGTLIRAFTDSVDFKGGLKLNTLFDPSTDYRAKVSGLLLAANHKVKASIYTSGMKFNLYTEAGKKAGINTYYSDIAKCDDLLCVDGQAPTYIGGEPFSDWTKDNKKFTTFFYEKDSGLNKINIKDENGNIVTTKTMSILSKVTSDSISYEISKEGISKYTFVVSDNVGNVYNKDFVVKIDKTAPAIKGIPSSEWTKDNVDITMTATDLGSGMKTIELYDGFNNKISSGLDSLHFTISTPGTNMFKVIATDNVGNKSERLFVTKIDTIAPNANVDFSYTEDNFTLKINANKIVESESGVEKVFAKYYKVGEPSPAYVEDLVPDETEEIITREDFNSDGIVNSEDVKEITTFDQVSFGNKNWNCKYDLNYDGIIDSTDIEIVKTKIGTNYSYTGGGDIQKFINDYSKGYVEIWAIDNVGNERKLSKYDFDLWTIEAKIIRTLEPHEPNFRTGEEGVLQITLKGYVEKVNVEFPKELLALNNSLNTSFVLTPIKEDSIEYKFIIPLNTPESSYNVKVTAFKETKQKVRYPKFDVKGSILDSLRTRIIFN